LSALDFSYAPTQPPTQHSISGEGVIMQSIVTPLLLNEVEAYNVVTRWFERVTNENGKIILKPEVIADELQETGVAELYINGQGLTDAISFAGDFLTLLKQPFSGKNLPPLFDKSVVKRNEPHNYSSNFEIENISQKRHLYYRKQRRASRSSFQYRNEIMNSISYMVSDLISKAHQTLIKGSDDFSNGLLPKLKTLNPRDIDFTHNSNGNYNSLLDQMLDYSHEFKSNNIFHPKHLITPVKIWIEYAIANIERTSLLAESFENQFMPPYISMDSKNRKITLLSIAEMNDYFFDEKQLIGIFTDLSKMYQVKCTELSFKSYIEDDERLIFDGEIKFGGSFILKADNDHSKICIFFTTVIDQKSTQL